MRKLSKTLLSLLLIAAMLASFVVLPAAAEEPAAEQPTEAVQAAETQADDAEKSNYELSIVMLDCGRKYFSVDSIKQIIDNAAAAGFNNVMLAVGNDGMRFLLDDMSLTVNGTTYSSEEVAAAIHTGNEAYYNFTTDELTESEMDEIIAYAKTKGLGIIPVINTPGHMDAILDAAEALTGKTCSYNGSARTIDVTNSTAVAFTQAFVQKYVDYFASKGCQYFNMGADEYANDKYTGGSMGFGNLQNTGKYSYYVKYVNAVAALIKNAGMTPMAFNDGIYFANNTSSGTFDTDIVTAIGRMAGAAILRCRLKRLQAWASRWSTRTATITGCSAKATGSAMLKRPAVLIIRRSRAARSTIRPARCSASGRTTPAQRRKLP